MSEPPDGGLLGWAERRWFRWTITGLVGLARFVLGAMYLSLGRQPDIAAFLVLGGEHVRAGRPAVVRVSARYTDSHRSIPVAVSGVAVGGRPGAERVEEGNPAIVRFRVPPDAEGTVKLELTAEAGERSERLAVDLPVLRAGALAEGVSRAPPSLSGVDTDHRVEILPEAGVLAGGMENRVFVRVLDGQGRPVGGADVVVEHATLPGGRVARRTDASGLVDLELTGSQPSFRLDLQVTDGDRVTKTDTLLRPHGRKLLLRLDPPVVPVGAPVRPTLITWNEDVEVVCDLLSGGVWVRSLRVRSVHGEADLDLGPLDPGLHRLQCSMHPLAPGEAFATLPIVVSDAPPLNKMLDEVRERNLAPLPAAVAPDGTDLDLALAYWQAVLREAPREPEVLLASREEDLAARKEARDRIKSRLLLAIGGVALLVLLWAAEHVVRNTLATRDRMRAFAVEAAGEGDDVDIDELSVAGFQQRETLARAQGLLLTVVVLGTIIANVVGLLGLFYLIR